MRVKKIRLPRIDRDDTVTVHEDENSHLWAVSYSDFLMALLSFFILFYSSGASTKKTIILNLANQFTPGGTGVGYGNTKGDGDVKSANRIPATVLNSLQDLSVVTEKDGETLIANFPDSFFNPGEHTIRADHEKQITDFLEKIKPYGNDVNLYFEGHTDDKPLNHHKNSIIVDNYVLSSLRASSALRVAQKMGFTEKNLFIQADSSNVRNSRSLSIRIEPKREIL